MSPQALTEILAEAVGIATAHGRGAPSPGRLYPLDVVVFVLRIEGIPSGVYAFDATSHSLSPLVVDLEPRELLNDILGPSSTADEAAFHVFLVGDEDELKPRFGTQSPRYLALEAGRIVQSMILIATDLKYGSCAIGHFDATALQREISHEIPGRPVHSAAFGYPTTRRHP